MGRSFPVFRLRAQDFRYQVILSASQALLNDDSSHPAPFPQIKLWYSLVQVICPFIMIDMPVRKADFVIIKSTLYHRSK